MSSLTWEQRCGTTWAGPEKGATVQELIEATRVEGGASVSTDHGRRLFTLAYRCGADYRTNLALTGLPITYYDLRRIASAK
jgi:hypothetical protein